MKDRQFLQFEVLDLPLVDDDGHIDHFLHACLPAKAASTE